jgi:RNA polymerase sigma-70 factor (ECF subfamily)
VHDVDDYYPQCPEALVVSMARTGDRSAFAELVKRRQSSIRALMRRCSNDGTLADDLAQQVFLQAWQKIHTLKKAGAFGGWLKRLAISVWLQHQRRNDALHGADELAGHESAKGDPTGVAMDLDRALATLPDPVRLSVVLSYQEGMTHEEIAELTDTPLGTVKSHINRGAQKLRQLLAAYGDEHGTEKAQ